MARVLRLSRSGGLMLVRGLLRDCRCRPSRAGCKCRYAERNCTDASEAPDEQNDVHGPSPPLNTPRACREVELDAQLCGTSEYVEWTVVDVARMSCDGRALDRRKPGTMTDDDRRCCQQLKRLLDTNRVVRRMSARMRHSVDGDTHVRAQRCTRMVIGMTR